MRSRVRLWRLFSPAGLKRSIPSAIVLLLLAAVAFSIVEPHRSVWDGVWWAFVTVATVGYGDVYPTTDAGRVIGLAVMGLGIGFLFLMTGAVIEFFIRAELRGEAVVLRRLDRMDDRLARIEALLAEQVDEPLARR